MADGFSDLEEFVMGVLVRERKTALHTIADADEIINVIVGRCRKLVEEFLDQKINSLAIQSEKKRDDSK